MAREDEDDESLEDDDGDGEGDKTLRQAPWLVWDEAERENCDTGHLGGLAGMLKGRTGQPGAPDCNNQ